MAEVGEPDFATGLFDTALSCYQHFFGAEQPVLIIIIVQGEAVYLFEKIL